MPSLKLVRLWAALLLATICMQAILPSPPSLERRSGSAFSAATEEVALFVERGERVQRQAVAPLPTTAFATTTSVQRAPSVIPAQRPSARPDSTGPPLRDIHSWDPAPRAPPRA